MVDNKLSTWKFHSKSQKVITFIVTQDCQLACKYCYLVGKNDKNRMTFEIAKMAIDYILDNRVFFNEDRVNFEFIGGEPFLEIDLIDKICDYLKIQMYRKHHPWFDRYSFDFTTNGINYHSAKVQNYIAKNIKHVAITITIDGTKTKHDINRVYKNSGLGSYDDVVRNIPLWIRQLPNIDTKVTISSADIPYIFESVKHIYELGIHTVNMNCVNEDVWIDGDDERLEEQLILLADYIIDHELYKDFTCSIFDKKIGKPNKDNNNWCGAGKMMSIDASGNFYPCTRFVDYSLREKEPRIIGNVYDGIDTNKVRPFILLDKVTQSSSRCVECEIAKGCSWCQGENYDSSETGTIYHRQTAICKMHHARVRANNYYWNKLQQHINFGGSEEPHSVQLKELYC